jgi:hypothetical protein
MAQDSYWFKHDSTASRDIKLMKIKHLYDFWGIGLYWSTVELLREQNNYSFPADESGLNMVCDLVRCSDMVRFKNWFNDCIKIKLFVIAENEFFSESLIKRMDNWETKKVNGGKGGRPKKTETISEIKPNGKANQKHKIREDKIIEYNNRKLKFSETLKPFLSTYGKDMLNDFYVYWTEPNKSGTKFRMESQKFWDIKKRLATWDKNKFETKKLKHHTPCPGLPAMNNG